MFHLLPLPPQQREGILKETVYGTNANSRRTEGHDGGGCADSG